MATKYRFKNSKRRKSKQRKFTSKGGVATLTEPTKSRVTTKKDEDQKSIDFQNMMAGFLNGCLEYAKEQNDQNLIKGLQLHSLCRYIERQRQREKEGYKVAINVIKEHTQNAYKLIDACSGNRSEAFERFREQYMKQFSKDERQKGGKVYTPPEIVKWIHDKLEEQSPLSLHKTYWDPACGTGHFPLDWYDRLMKHWEENKDQYPEIKDEHEAHKWITEKCIYFSDIDPFAIRLCKFGLFLKDPTIQPEFNAFQGDSLLDEPFGDRTFDYVAGNPPYDEIKNFYSDTYKEELRGCYETMQSRGYRLSDAFGELALKRSRNIGFVTQDGWLLAKYANAFRSLLEQPLVIIEHRADIRECFKKQRVGVDAVVYIAAPFNKDANVILDGQVVRKTDGYIHEFYEPSFVEEVDIAVLDKIELQSTLEEVGDVIDGIETGDDKHFIKSTGQYKLVSAKSVKKYQQKGYKGAFNPVEGDRQIKSFRRLEDWEDVSIFVRFYVQENDWGFCLRQEGYGKNSNTFGIITEHPKFLLGILNSKVMQYYCCKTAKRRSTNHKLLMLYQTTYRALPIPSHDSRLEPLVNKMLENPNDTETQAEIDQIVYDLYGLTEEEIKVIEEVVK